MLSLLFACATCVQINLDQLALLAGPDTPWHIVSRAAGLVADEAQRLKDAGCPDANGCRAEDYRRVLQVQGELDQASRNAFYTRPDQVDEHLAMLDREGDLLRKLSRCELGDAPRPPDLAAELEGISSNLSRDREAVARAAALP
jgi:hypothetical protein